MRQQVPERLTRTGILALNAGARCLIGKDLFLRTSPLVSCTACAGAGFAGDCSDVLLDLYSGTGTIALCLASRCRKVYGVESNQHAVDDAMENARYNCKTNAIFLQADLSKDEDMAHVAQHVPRPDIVVAGTSRFFVHSQLPPCSALLAEMKLSSYFPCLGHAGAEASQ